MSELLEKIRSRGYWKVAIHPATFVEKRVSDIAALYPILEKTSVQLRRWGFPHLDTWQQRQPQFGVDWIGQEILWHQFLEIWRFYQSGQFVAYLGMDEDWRDQSGLWRAPEGWEPGAFLSVLDAMFHFTEIFEFAARLSRTQAGDQQMHLEIVVSGLKHRALWFDPSKIMPSGVEMKATIEELPYKVDLPQLQLFTEPRELALKPARELFQHFGWEPSLDLLRDIQDELLRRRSVAASP
jgi:hypothetical protein